MATKKKITTAVVAGVTAVALMLGGTFAWQSINQTALNEASDVINPGGRLHDDFYINENGDYDADIYVENFAEDEIFARVKLQEYMEIVINYGSSAQIVEPITGSKSLDGVEVTDKATDKTSGYKYSYVTHYFDRENATDKYWDWAMGTSNSKDVYYMPTFNMNKDSLNPDRNGMYVDRIGGISNRGAAQYEDYTIWASGDTKDGTEIYDYDSNWDDEVGYDFENLSTYVDAENIVTVDATHTAALVGDTNGLISMTEWLDKLNNGEETENYWVYDTDGWIYWSSPIAGGTATGLLLDAIDLDDVMDDTWYYAINAIGEFVTADDVGKSGGTGFYADDAEAPSSDAEILLEEIGVDMSSSESEYILGKDVVDAILAIENPGSSTDTVTIDGVEFYVLAVDEENAQALLFAKSVLEDENGMYIRMMFDEDWVSNTFATWEDSDVRTYLNETWLSSMPTLSQAAIETTITTREYPVGYTDTDFIETQDKVFLLTQADVSYDGKIGGGTWSPYGTSIDATEQDYTYDNAALIEYDADDTTSYFTIRGFEYDFAKDSATSGPYAYYLRHLNDFTNILCATYEGGTTHYASVPANSEYSTMFLRPAVWVSLDVVESNSSDSDDEGEADPYGFSHLLMGYDANTSGTNTFFSGGYLTPGDKIDYNVTAYYNNGTMIDITSGNVDWSVDVVEGTLAGGTTIDDDGVLTVSSSQGDLSVLKVTVTFTDADGVEHEKSLATLVSNETITLSLTSSNTGAYYTGVEYTFTATATNVSGSTVPMEWKYSYDADGLAASVDHDGTFTASDAGTYTIKAWAEYVNGMYAELEISVAESVPGALSFGESTSIASDGCWEFDEETGIYTFNAELDGSTYSWADGGTRLRLYDISLSYNGETVNATGLSSHVVGNCTEMVVDRVVYAVNSEESYVAKLSGSPKGYEIYPLGPGVAEYEITVWGTASDGSMVVGTYEIGISTTADDYQGE